VKDSPALKFSDIFPCFR